MASSPPSTARLGSTPSESPEALKVLVVSGQDFGREVLLLKGTYRVGSAPGNDLQLSDPAVSRVHLTLSVLAGSVRVTDNHSTNGSFCRGIRFESMVAKPGVLIQLGNTVLKIVSASDSVPALRPSTQERFQGLVGKSVQMRELFAKLERISASDGLVCIEGETGTGKDVCARAIHAASARAGKPFIVCDLASLSPGLFEAELFGHVKGAFTNADRDRPGLFESADGGTLFLDEVGEVALELQPRLLRVLETHQVKRVGEERVRTVNVRVIAATHRDLPRSVEDKTFREDLLHRLAALQVRLPPLRDRPEDIPLLVDDILKHLGHPPSRLSPEARQALAAYDWPGNVRELRNVVERVLHLGETSLPPPDMRRPGGAPKEGNLSFKDAKEKVIHAFERDYLSQLLDDCQGNISAAARKAGMDRVHFWRLLKKRGLEAKSGGADG